MNIALRRALTVEEYLAWADAQSEQPRAELINGHCLINPDLMNVTHHARAPDVVGEGSLRLDPPGLEVGVADLLGAA